MARTAKDLIDQAAALGMPGAVYGTEARDWMKAYGRGAEAARAGLTRNPYMKLGRFSLHEAWVLGHASVTNAAGA